MATPFFAPFPHTHIRPPILRPRLTIVTHRLDAWPPWNQAIRAMATSFETLPPPSDRPTCPPSEADLSALEAYEQEVKDLGEWQARLNWLSKTIGVR